MHVVLSFRAHCTLRAQHEKLLLVFLHAFGRRWLLCAHALKMLLMSLDMREQPPVRTHDLASRRVVKHTESLVVKALQPVSCVDAHSVAHAQTHVFLLHCMHSAGARGAVRRSEFDA